jgi:hypothetical protein
LNLALSTFWEFVFANLYHSGVLANSLSKELKGP